MFANVMLMALSLSCAIRTATRLRARISAKGHLPRTRGGLGDEAAPRRRKQGQSGNSNLPAQHNETGRDITPASHHTYRHDHNRPDLGGT